LPLFLKWVRENSKQTNPNKQTNTQTKQIIVALLKETRFREGRVLFLTSFNVAEISGQKAVDAIQQQSIRSAKNKLEITREVH
jgi:hypothetical protein